MPPQSGQTWWPRMVRRGYHTVKPYVRKLCGNQPLQPRAVTLTGPGEKSQVDCCTGAVVRDPQTRSQVLYCSFALGNSLNRGRWDCEGPDQARRAKPVGAALSLLISMSSGEIHNNSLFFNACGAAGRRPAKGTQDPARPVNFTRAWEPTLSWNQLPLIVLAKSEHLCYGLFATVVGPSTLGDAALRGIANRTHESTRWNLR